MKIVLASANKGKLAEFQTLLAPLNYQLLSQAEFKIEPCPEPASTFIENAILKARHAAKKTKLAALADDSGLIVPALQDEPGVISARYAGVNATMSENISKLLMKMKDLKGEQRKAYFYCVLVFLRHETDPTPIFAEGFWQGEILEEKRGDGGFGYDPIFFVNEKNCSAAELSIAEKNSLSHRGKASRQLLKSMTELK